MNYAYFLVFSNLIYLICAIVLILKSLYLYKRIVWAWEITQFILICIISSLYHACDDISINTCIIDYTFLRIYDILCAYNAFVAAGTIHLNIYCQETQIYQIFINIFTLFIILFVKIPVNQLVIIISVNMFVIVNYICITWQENFKSRYFIYLIICQTYPK